MIAFKYSLCGFVCLCVARICMYKTNFSKYFQQQPSNRINLNYAYMDCNTGKLHTLLSFNSLNNNNNNIHNVASVPVIYIHIKFQASADGMCAHIYLTIVWAKCPFAKLKMPCTSLTVRFSLFSIQNFIYMYIV